MTIDEAINGAVKDFDGAMEHLRSEFSRLQVGRASPGLVEGVMVDVYGSKQPLKAVATISVPDPRTIQIQPWDKSNLAPIEKGILAANLGLNPVNDGAVVRIAIPPLTEERRSELTKHVHKLAEEAKISIRNARQDAIKKFKQMKDDGDLTDDDLTFAEKKLQGRVDEYNGRVDEAAQIKEKDVMTV